jgi:hypothetical protein
MIKKVLCCCLLLVVTSALYANGIPQLTAEEIAGKSVQALRSLQSQLKSSIDMEIGQAKCNEDSQCKALAIGANPCGGPETFQAYSTLDSDSQQLTEMAAQYALVRKTLHAKTGTLGACMVIPEPAVQCKNHQCVTIQKSDVLVF